MPFDEKGLLSSTVAHYHAALSVPLRIVLFINVLNPAVSDMLRAVSLIRPSCPFTAPSWSLQEVMDHIEGLPVHISYVDTLASAVFFLLLVLDGIFWSCGSVLGFLIIALSHWTGNIVSDPTKPSWSRMSYLIPGGLTLLLRRFLPLMALGLKLCPVIDMELSLAVSRPKSVGPFFISKVKPLSVFSYLLEWCVIGFSMATLLLGLKSKILGSSLLPFLHAFDGL